MRYIVHVVGDDELPAGTSKVIVEREHGPALIIINGEPARCWQFMQAWQDSMGEVRCPEVPTLLFAV